MNFDEIKKLDELHGDSVYTKRDVAIVRGEGAHVWDINGKEYIDCGISFGVSNVGHCNKDVAEAIIEQVKQLLNIQLTYYDPLRSRLLEKLTSIVGLDKVFLTNSGTEAVEAALKFSRASTGRTEIIAAMCSFHGRSFGSLSATWKKEYRKPFEPLVPDFKFVPYDNLEKLRDAISDKTAAVILEPLQGEGGVRSPSDNYFKEVRKLCDENGTLLIVDEVQTGFARTGKMFCFQHYGIKPDIVTVAKAIAGGFPMGAMIGTKKVFNVPKHSHGTTFGGNPVACAAALANINYIEKTDLAGQAREKGEYFFGLLRGIKSDKIRDIRGKGLMVGIELKEKSGPYLNKLIERGIIALPAGPNVLRFLPPLVISKEDLEKVANTLGEILG